MSEASEINPFEYLMTALIHWKEILSISILFAVLGIGVSNILPPVYQASSVLQVDIDYQRTAPLDDVTVMKAYEKVRGVIVADDVLEAALLAAEAGVGPSDEFHGITDVRDRIRVSQRPDGWELVVFSRDPSMAAALANAWSDSSIQELADGLRHSLMAWEWQGALYSAHCKLELDPRDESRTLWSCSTSAAGLDPNTISEAILEEVRLTRGILSFFSFSIQQRATVPAAPILWQRGMIVLVGSLLGLGIGFIWAVGRPVKRMM